MIAAIKHFFERHLSEPGPADDERRERRLQVATGALLIELAHADFDASPEELQRAAAALQATFGLSAAQTEELVGLAEEQARQATDYYHFTSLINRGFTPAEKVKLIELMWQVAYTDGRIDKYEDHLVRKIAGLLHVSHTDFIATKQRARSAHAG
jgi:uncharacterized tellurite resistance protein B-like protein